MPIPGSPAPLYFDQYRRAQTTEPEGGLGWPHRFSAPHTAPQAPARADQTAKEITAFNPSPNAGGAQAVKEITALNPSPAAGGAQVLVEAIFSLAIPKRRIEEDRVFWSAREQPEHVPRVTPRRPAIVTAIAPFYPDQYRRAQTTEPEDGLGWPHRFSAPHTAPQAPARAVQVLREFTALNPSPNAGAVQTIKEITALNPSPNAGGVQVIIEAILSLVIPKRRMEEARIFWSAQERPEYVPRVVPRHPVIIASRSKPFLQVFT